MAKALVLDCKMVAEEASAGSLTGWSRSWMSHRQRPIKKHLH